MDLMYQSTRNKDVAVTASQAILQGLSSDGGLFVPTRIPALDKSMKELSLMEYGEVAYEVLKHFLTDYTEEEMKACIAAAYDDKFDTSEIAPVKKVGNGYYLELFHGSTIAFKDMALSILPHLLTTAAKKNKVNDEIVILTATSGDTGKAALAGFADVPGTKIIVFYPKDGVSKVQEKQMVTQQGENTFVVGIHGNFDDAQTGVKNIFNDREYEKKLKAAGYQFSSANSINIGRLVPQIVYYVYTYSQLLKRKEIVLGEKINFVVPTGNFGNILAGYYAKKMGVPIDKLICASNENKVLFDFFSTGIYDRNREFVLTSSPSMDILVSSNLERLIYEIAGSDSVQTANFMESLSKTGKYEITKTMRENLQDFVGGYATTEQTSQAIDKEFKENGYIIDTHTAVALHVAEQYKEESKDQSKSVIVSTASPYKFVESVLGAVGQDLATEDDYENAILLQKITGIKIPKAVEELREASVLHNTVCEKEEMQNIIGKFLKII